MVTTRFIGRLGNSMFQIAACISYAKKYGYSWAASADARESAIHQVFPDLPKTTHVPSRSFPKRDAYDPQHFDYMEIPDLGPELFLPGFWQSWKYFAHCENEVKAAFKLDINPIDAVSIHVRRGDYVQYAGSFPPVTREYIAKALEKVPTATTHRYIVFSDDIAWCKEQFGEYAFEYSEGRNEREDLSLMASCKHHIIANSSFSWWGAWLGHNPDKIVVCPHEESWFGPENGVLRWYKENGKPIIPDMLPPSWVRVKFR
jgi:hypothetical protein